ncbi:MAG: HisA/HisF-related TIM barrel protein, partial [Gaiellales bacterium]
MLKRGEAIVIPAIDLLGGRVVRLQRGSYDRVTGFDVDPERAAAEYAEQGAAWLHLVDLDAARDGVRPPAHERVIRRLATRRDLRLQVGGGVRSAADVEALLELGV